MNKKSLAVISVLIMTTTFLPLFSCGNLMNDIINEIAAGTVDEPDDEEPSVTCTLTFDANGGSGALAAVTGAEGETVTLPANTFSRSGYDFYGWSDSSTGAISYYDEESYTLGAADAVLYARWNTENATDEGSFEYSIADGKASVTGYSGSDTELILPDILGGYPMTAINDRAFYECLSLTSVTIPGSVTSIGGYAFYNCYSLASVTIPDLVITIGDYAFFSCGSLTSVAIPDSVTTIGYMVFRSCISLISVTIPGSVIAIGGYAFDNCNSLTSVTIPDSVTSIGGGAFRSCDSLTSVTIGDSVTTIGGSAFDYCDSLASVTIGNSVTTIGDYAFYFCNSLTSVTIPDSVTTIGDSAFYSCDSLTSVTVKAISPPTLGDDVFFYCFLLSAIYVPASEDDSILDNYRTAWSGYAGIIQEQS